MVLGAVRARRKPWLLASLLGLLCAASASAVAAPGVARRDLLHPLRTDLRAAWTVADFDGDHLPDVVTASSSRNHSGSYTHLLRIGLSGLESAFFSFADANSQIRLTARDVDGDHNADLVVLGAVSPKPIDVWLNDGAGHFRRGDASGLAADTDSATLEAAAPGDDTLANVSDERSSLAAPLSVLWARREVIARASSPATEFPLASHRANVRSRAPPR